MEDKAIIALYWERDEKAIAETKGKFGNYCRQIALNILNSLPDAQECENDTYLAAWNTMPPQRPERLKCFLGRLVRNISLNRFDYQTAQKRGGGFYTVYEELEQVGVDDTQQQVEMAFVTKAVMQFLDKAKPEHQDMFVRRYWYCEKMADIARLFSVRENKVAVILFRMRRDLRTFLQEEGWVE